MGAVDVGTNRTRTFSSSISGDGGMLFFGNGGLLTLSGSNSFAGGLRISGVTVIFANDANLGQAGAPVFLESGSLILPAGYDLQRPLSVGSSTAQVSAGGNVHTLGGPVTGAGRLNLAGAARFTLTGNNSHSGGVALAGNAGAPAVLVLDSDARLGAAGGVLNIGRLNGSVVLPGRLEAGADLNIAATRSTSFRDMTVDTAGHSVVFTSRSTAWA
jgi:fibronectin-binding autotransporter adhesin